jgi:Entner-Doudoroff aldolase
MSVSLTDALAGVPLIAVLRGLDPAAASALAKDISAAGVRAVEITMDSPDATAGIERLRSELADDIAVGAGTVVTVHDVAAAVKAGASFCIAPHLDEEVVRAALSQGVAVVPGVGSATELHRAVAAGATMVKLFPAGALGLDYLRALRGPYPDVPIMVSGGVTIDAIPDWLTAGATAIGLGASTLTEPGAAAKAVAATK